MNDTAVAEPAAAPVPATPGPLDGEFDASGPTLAQALAAAPPDLAVLPAAARYVYRTSDTRFAALTGRGELDWAVQDGRYSARLALTVFGIPALELNSRGTVGPTGLAPDRYTEKPMGRSEMATNFDWTAARVTFSRKSHERPAPAGMQDRLSFQFQLMLLGAPVLARLQPGATLVLAIGGRDDTTRYRLAVIGPERVQTPAGDFDTVKLDKAKAPGDDARIEVWLAPALGWLPVRLRFTDRSEQVTENVIAEMQVPPK